MTRCEATYTLKSGEVIRCDHHEPDWHVFARRIRPNERNDSREGLVWLGDHDEAEFHDAAEAVPVVRAPVDFAEVMADISAVMTRIRDELGATHDIEGQLMSLLHQQLGSAHSTAFILLAYRRETRVTPEVVARRLVVTDSLTMSEGAS